MRQIRRALLSVYDKTGIVAFARSLVEAGVELISTGSTARTIAAESIPVTPVEDVTGFPECFDGRVKTLHPMIHGGILADRTNEAHVDELEKLNIAGIDLVVCNLYPFTQTVAAGANYEESIEQIDIGGPTMVRAAAKNHASVAVLTSPHQYDEVLAAIRGGGVSFDVRQRLAAEAFAHTAAYDVAVASWFAKQTDTGFAGIAVGSTDPLRYGENPHQQAWIARTGPGLANARRLGGKDMSYNNYQDTDAAIRAAYDHEGPAVAIVKHANPCGTATADTIDAAYRAAHACDPLSAFGSVIAANRTVTEAMAEAVTEVFTEVIAAPAYDEEALALLQTKTNLRILEIEPKTSQREYRQISGGILVQERDQVDAPGDRPAAWTHVSGEPAIDEMMADLEFAWRSVRSVKSNAILLAKGGATVGIGMGQVNRVDSAKLAVERANTLGEGERARGSVAASDAFFPFPDGLQVLIDAGVSAVVQPGGSIRDEAVIEAAKAANITMYLTGTRHFAH